MPPPRRLIVIFKTHLDLGYTDLAAAVLRRYIESFIPQAMATAQTLRERGGPERFVWTTGSWLITEFLEQASRRERRRMETAIELGDLRWHALPFTLQPELMDEGLFEFGLSLSADLDRRFGQQTLSAKITDVPGMTRAALPLLARAGVRLLHIGVNPATPLPAVPLVFRWRDPSGAELTVAYSGDYGRTITVRGLADELHFAHTGDNHGPQSAHDIIALFNTLREAHPGAQVVAGTLDDFAHALEPMQDRLPVVTAEIGDMWIHGVASDPVKIAHYRALLQFRQQALRKHPALAASPRWRKFSRALLCVPEHTWGRDTKIVVRHATAPWEIYTPGRWPKHDFARDRRQGMFADLEASWSEQRDYLRQATAALGQSPLGRQAVAALQACQPRVPLITHWRRATDVETTTGHRVRFDPRNGSLVDWVTPDGRRRADARHPLGLFSYQLFSPRDVERWYRDYTVNKEVTCSWSRPDFTKFGYEKLCGVRAKRWLAPITGMHVAETGIVTLRLQGPPYAAHDFGCPREIFIEWQFGENGAAQVALQWFGKDACRMPEAAWFSFHPRVSAPRAWRLVKLGHEIDPRDVVRRGNRRMHAVEAMRHPDLEITNLHAPLVRIGEANLLNFRQDLANARDGLHFNLVNNVWGTNFAQWCEDDARFEFKLFKP